MNQVAGLAVSPLRGFVQGLVRALRVQSGISANAARIARKPLQSALSFWRRFRTDFSS
jgi:hypothetical protein